MTRIIKRRKIIIKRKNVFLSLFPILIVYLYLMESSFPFSDGSNILNLFFYLKFGLSIVIIAYSLFSSRKRIVKANSLGTLNYIQLLLLIPWILILACSLISWMINTPNFEFISRGVSNWLYAVLAIMMGFALFKIYGVEIIYIVAKAVCLMVLTNYCMGVVDNGPTFLVQLFNFSCIDSTILKYKELHEIAYISGLILLWYYLRKGYSRRIKLNKIVLLILILAFVFAFKRIGLAAFAASFVFAFICKRFGKDGKKYILGLCGFGLFAVAFIYIMLTTSGELIDMLKKVGINAMGRDILYTYFNKLIEVSPFFIGRGIGFVSRQFSYIKMQDVGFVMFQLKQGLHNDFFRLYIEIGMIGTILWLLYQCFYLPKVVKNKFGIRCSMCIIAFLIYSFITYLTDNTLSYFAYQMVLAILLTESLVKIRKKEQQSKKIIRIKRYISLNEENTVTA